MMKLCGNIIENYAIHLKDTGKKNFILYIR
jgi:hypothetical protein